MGNKNLFILNREVFKLAKKHKMIKEARKYPEIRNLQDPSKFKDILKALKRMDLVQRVLSDHGSKIPLKSRHVEERLSTSTVMVASHPDNDHHTSAREFIPRSPPDSSPIIGTISAPTVPLYPEPRIDDALFETEDGIGIPLSTACPGFIQPRVHLLISPIGPLPSIPCISRSLHLTPNQHN